MVKGGFLVAERMPSPRCPSASPSKSTCCDPWAAPNSRVAHDFLPDFSVSNLPGLCHFVLWVYL